MKTLLRLYQNEAKNRHSASIFDLIDGNHETKQTKSLSYLFFKFPGLVEFFILKIEERTKKKMPQCRTADFIQVDAEMVSAKDYFLRRDITLSFYQHNKLYFVIVFEAKSINVGSKHKDIENQLNSYLDSTHYPHEKGVQKMGVTITKYPTLHSLDNGFFSFTWTDVITILTEYTKKNPKVDGHLIEEYNDFLKGVGRGMRYYEIEVLSVAAGGTHGLTGKHFIHSCPQHQQGYNYKEPLFITFREKNGGEMQYLYKIEDIIVLDPYSPSLEVLLANYDVEFGERILSYIQDRKNGFGFKHRGEEYRFYNLSKTSIIDLKHKPKPEVNNSGARYYTLAELLKGNKIVHVESKV